MYNVSFRIVKSREDAEDIIQECFIKGFQKIHQIKEEVSLGAWLKRIVVNASLDSIRKKKKETWIEETRVLEVETEEKEVKDTTDVSVMAIKECMNQLKEKYRIILVLYMIEDYNHREISQLLNLKESTVRNQYRRGKNQLIELLQKTTGNGFKKAHTGS
jgi:RNA polymerase sigma-70 factor (ECF subfamily)